MLTPPRIAVLLVLAAALIVVPFVWPSGGDDDLSDEVDALRAELRERDAVEDELRDRLDALEAAQTATLDELATDDDTDPVADRLAAIEEDLGELLDALTVLESDVEAGASSRAQLQQRIDAVDADLRGALAEVRDGVDELRGQLALLEDQLIALRIRVDELG